MQKRFESELEKRVLKIFEYLGYEFDNKIWVNDEKDISQLLYVPEYEILHTLQEGITNKIDGNTDNVKKVPIIDFQNIQNNKFGVVTNFRTKNYMCDAIITINNIPIAIVEWSSNSKNSSMKLQKYIAESENMMLNVAPLLIAIDEKSLLYKANSKMSDWREWEAEGTSGIMLQKVVNFFEKNVFLDLLENYMYYSDGKMQIATYYQYIATNKMINSKDKVNRVNLATGTGYSVSLISLLKQIIKKGDNKKTLIIVESLAERDILMDRIINILGYDIRPVSIANRLEDLLEDISAKIIITPIHKLIRYNIEYSKSLNIIAKLSSIGYQRTLNRVSSNCFKDNTLYLYTNIKTNGLTYLYDYSEIQAIKDGVLTRTFYMKKVGNRDTKSVAEDICKNSIKNDKSIIFTENEEKCLEYIKYMSEEKNIGTISISKEQEKNEIFKDLIRENGNILTYKMETLRAFNMGGLELLVISSIQDLERIRAFDVNKIYLDTQINSTTLRLILSILNKRENGKEQSIIVDYADNEYIISTTLETDLSENKNSNENIAIVNNIKGIVHEARKLYYTVLIQKNEIQRKLKCSEQISTIGVEQFYLDISKWINKISYIYALDNKQEVQILETQEKKRYKEGTIQLLKMADKLSVIYLKEIKDIKKILENLKEMEINDFKFTLNTQEDFVKYPNIEGVWQELSEIQRTEAVKNRLKKYLIYSSKYEYLLKVEESYKNNEINEKIYRTEIEKLRLDWVESYKTNNIPEKIRKNEFALSLYQNIKSTNKIQFLSEEALIKFILEIENCIKEKIKVDWKDNFYLWKKVEVSIIEVVYMFEEQKEIIIAEDYIDQFLIDIKAIAINTIDINSNKEEEKFYYIKKKNAYAMGKPVGKGFLVLKNSTTVEGYSERLTPCFAKIGQELREKKVIVNNKFTRDYKFNSPSTAANIILGRNSNGRIEWRDKNGQTIQRLYTI